MSSFSEVLKVDFSKEIGTIRRLNGVCCATPLANARKKSLDSEVRKLEIPYFQTHDSELQNPGLELVDVSRIFPLFHADVNDERNYFFEATDDYLKQVIDAGSEVEFRLGESIEHSPKQYRVKAPEDYEKWADICCHIIRHYNEGWANGFKWNIRYWTIWEEPNTVPMLLTGSDNPFIDIYLPLYKAAATKIKKEFPDVQVGGPQTGWVSGSGEPFLDYCQKNNIPLDFFGFTIYSRNPETILWQTKVARELLDSHGYNKAGIHILEWHWGPINWAGHATNLSQRASKAWLDELNGMDSTAFTATMLICMQDSFVDRMFYYAIKGSNWGLFDANGIKTGSYWSMFAFAQLAHGVTRVETEVSSNVFLYDGNGKVVKPNWYALASLDKTTGKGRILVSTLRTDNACTVAIRGGMKPVSVKVIDAVRDLEEHPGWSWDAEKRSLTIPRMASDSSVWLIETDPE